MFSSILNVFLIVFSALAALTTAVCVCRFVIEKKCNVFISIACCILSALLGGILWMPATLAVVVIFATEIKQAQ